MHVRGNAAALTLLVLLVLLVLAGCAATPPRTVQAGSIIIDHMVIPAEAEAGGEVAAYAGFDNRGGDDRLLGIDCDCAQSVELHRVIREAGGSRMTTVFPLALPAGVRTEVKPPGIPLHFMLIRTRRPFAVGEQVPMRLRFEHAGTRTVTFVVVARSADGWAVWPEL